MLVELGELFEGTRILQLGRVPMGMCDDLELAEVLLREVCNAD